MTSILLIVNKLLIVSMATVAVIILALATLVLVSQPDTHLGTVELTGDGGNVTRLNVEIADTPEAHRTGLMNRSSLAGDAGMIFVFSNDERRYFWMENTEIPLDMIFISKDLTIIDIHENATPMSRDTIASSGSCRYVLEVNGGRCKAIGIEVGDHVRLDLN